MTLKTLYRKLRTLKIPVAYFTFGKPTEPPFLVYAVDGEDDFSADNTHYCAIRDGWIEVYADGFNELLPLLEKLEKMLTRNNIPWRKVNEDYISGERLAYARYTFTLLPKEA